MRDRCGVGTAGREVGERNAGAGQSTWRGMGGMTPEPCLQRLCQASQAHKQHFAPSSVETDVPNPALPSGRRGPSKLAMPVAVRSSPCTPSRVLRAPWPPRTSPPPPGRAAPAGLIFPDCKLQFQGQHGRYRRLRMPNAQAPSPGSRQQRGSPRPWGPGPLELQLQPGVWRGSRNQWRELAGQPETGVGTREAGWEQPCPPGLLPWAVPSPEAGSGLWPSAPHCALEGTLNSEQSFSSIGRSVVNVRSAREMRLC